MLPLLQVLADGREYRNADVVAALAERFHLSEEDLAAMLPSGQQRTFSNRAQSAKPYLGKAGLVIEPSRGVVRITPEGCAVLAGPPSRIDIPYLMRFPSFEAFRRASPGTQPTTLPAPDSGNGATPEELLEQAWRALRQQSADELLDRVRQCSPAFFERLVIDLLVAMGYGGSRVEAGQSIGRSGDGGIDGRIINEDRLGLDMVYIQAKRWEGTVGRPVVQNFAGSLEGVRARKGVIITTSTFSSEAKEYVTHIEKRIVLIDGATLADLMLEHDVGVTTAQTYALKRIDINYFEER